MRSPGKARTTPDPASRSMIIREHETIRPGTLSNGLSLKEGATMLKMQPSVAADIPARRNSVLILLALILFSAFTFYLYAGADEANGLSMKEAMSLAKDGKTDEAIALIRKIIQSDPGTDMKEARIRLGLINFKAGRHESALNEFEKVIELKSDSSMAYYFTGLIYEKLAIAKTDKNESMGLKRKALNAWTNYLACAKTGKERPESHKNICISVEESIKRAQKHVDVLNGELTNEKP